MNCKSNSFPFPNHLTPESALALFDSLSNLIEVLWQQYEPVLLEQILQDLNLPPDDHLKPEFYDDIPF
jgi:hypothetical protein